MPRLRLPRDSVNSSLRIFAGIALGFMFTGYCKAGPPPKETSRPTFRIVFERIDTPEMGFASYPYVDIYVMDQDGGNTKRLTFDHGSHSPSWSPDGNQIVFLSEQRRPISTFDNGFAEFALYRDFLRIRRDVRCMDADGQNPSLIASSSAAAQGVMWFPDGKRIGIRTSGRNALQVLVDPSGRLSPDDLHSESLRQYLKSGTPLLSGGYVADYSTLLEWVPPPDNFFPTFVASTAFEHHVNPDVLKSVPTSANLDASLRVVSRDGSPASSPVTAYDLAWSSDAKRIAYSTFTAKQFSVLYVADVQGDEVKGDPHALTDQALDAHEPAWSGGGRLAFEGLWKDTSQIFIVGEDGGNLIQLSRNTKLFCYHPSWSPDGKWIVADCRRNLTVMQPLTSEMGGLSSIYLFDVGKPGSKPRQLTRCATNYPLPTCGARNPSFAPTTN